ncbi:MAG: hypothetical protein C0483_24260 [Pirellula sp.]|nr:hypothetical protein [Pirellula sp.]
MQQLSEALQFDSDPRYLVCDNDQIHGDEFSRRVAGMGIRGGANYYAQFVAKRVRRTFGRHDPA